MLKVALAGVVLLIIVAAVTVYSIGRSPGRWMPDPVVKQASSADLAAFTEIIERDDLEQTKAMLERWPDLATTHDFEGGETALHHAPSIPMAQLLIDRGADPAARDRHSKTAARWVASNWHEDVRKYLETKAPAETDIAYLAAAGQADVIARMVAKLPELLDFRTAPEDVLGGGRHLLHIASTYGQPAVVKVLLDAGADASVDGGWNNSQPLENAAWAGYPEVVELLVQHGADLEARESGRNHTALWYAAITGRTEVVQILLGAGAKIEDGMIRAVEDSKSQPYPGRELPDKSEYDAVIALLRQHGGKE